MTVVKQTGVHSARHSKSLERYLDWGRDKVEGHGTQHLVRDGSAKECIREMDDTRRAYGHDRPGKAGAKATLAYHQILSWLPEECSMNGGPMTAERCLEYARRYVEVRYPNVEAFWVLHRERGGDGVERYSAHILLNRTLLDGPRAGLRLDEGPARVAARARAETVRELDAEFDLRQLERGKRNSKIHARQPSREEKLARKRSGGRSENDEVRAKIAAHVQEISRMNRVEHPERELARRLRADGIELGVSKNGDLQYRYKAKSLGGKMRKINGTRLGAVRSKRTGKVMSLSRSGVRLAISAALYMAREAERDMYES